MKYLKTAALALLAIAWAVTAALAAGPSYRLDVAGLACPFCAYGIEKKLNALESVERVDTHIKESVVIITMADGATLDEASAKVAVKEAGFTLDGFGRVPEGGTQ